MSALLRDSALGQLIRLATNNKTLLYPEERPDFQCPYHYTQAAQQGTESIMDGQTPPESNEMDEKNIPPLDRIKTNEKTSSELAPAHRPESIEEEEQLPARTPNTEKDFDLGRVMTARTALTRVDTRVTLGKVTTRRDLEQAYITATLERGPTMPIIPEKLDDGTILVDWYDTEDPENPQNWSPKKKYFVTFQIW